MNAIPSTLRQTGESYQGSGVVIGGQHGRRKKASFMKSLGKQAALALGSLFASALVSSAAPKLYPGVVQVEYFLGIGGGAVSDLTGNAKYQNNTPDVVLFPTSAQSICGYGDNYGARMTGLFTPAADGDYTFYISGDDHIELWLSTDETPANLTKIAVEPDWNDCKQWITGNTNGGSRPDGGRPTSANVDAAQTAPNISVPKSLIGGKSYLFQALLKEGGGGDGVGVTVVSPGEAAPLDGEDTRLTSGVISVVADDAPHVLSGPSSTAAVYAPGAAVVLTATYYTPPDQAEGTYQWFRNGSAISGANSASYSLTADVADDGAKFKVRYTIGTASADSGELTLKVRGLVEAIGFAKFEKFSGIGGGNVTDLTGNQKYIDNAPDQVSYVGGFEGPPRASMTTSAVVSPDSSFPRWMATTSFMSLRMTTLNSGSAPTRLPKTRS